MSCISIRNLTKSFGSHIVLDNLSLEIYQNEIFGILGADGAGKSTLFRILATLLLQDSGECRILGLDSIQELQKIRATLGYMPGTFSLYTDLSVIENLEFFAAIFHVSLEENYDLIRDIYAALEPFKHRKAGALSGGMKQKLALCCALIHKPQILLLDEPTTGVDMVSRREFWEILSTLKSEMTIIASTPYMDEASMCDRVALLHEGKILSIGAPSAITRSFPHRIYACEFGGDSDNFASGGFVNLGEKLALIRALPIVHSCFLFGNVLHVVFKDNVNVEALNLNSEISESNSSLRGSGVSHNEAIHNTNIKKVNCHESATAKSCNDSILESSNKNMDCHAFARNDKKVRAAFQGAKLYEITPDIEDCFMEFLQQKRG